MKKYQPNHKCKTSCYLLVEQEEIEEILQEQEEEENAKAVVETSQLQALEIAPDISFNVLAG